MVEFDVRRTADGVLVIHHDASGPDGAIAERTFDELARGGSRLPRLADFLAACGGRIALDVELKERGYEREVLSTVLATVSPAEVVVTSFAAESLEAVKRTEPEVATGLLVGGRAGRGPEYLVEDMFPLGRLEACGADFLAPSDLLVRLGISGRAARRGYGVLVWTVNDERRIAALQAQGPPVLGVVTDAPVQSAAVSSALPSSMGT
jgi:glycerophosphoryl diester phosphodiesterase